MGCPSGITTEGPRHRSGRKAKTWGIDDLLPGGLPMAIDNRKKQKRGTLAPILRIQGTEADCGESDEGFHVDL